MTIIQSLIPQFEQEMSVTRNTLERIPDEKFLWKPHTKSMALGSLVSHIAEIPSWSVPTIAQASLDLAPVGGPAYSTPQLTSRAQVLAAFDKNCTAALEILPSVSDQTLMESWALLVSGKEVFKMPKIGVLRSFIISHTIHHRAQLGVYLRLNDISHPSMYGPSADEGLF